MKTHHAWIMFTVLIEVIYVYPCNFPPGLVGTFDSTKEGTLVFNTTHYGTFTFRTQSQTFSNLEFGCHINSGTKYVSKSSSFPIFNSNFYAYMCLDITQVTDNLYYYHYGTQQLPQAGDARIKIFLDSTVVGSVGMICDESVPYQQPYSLLFKNDSVISEEMIPCPADLQGYFNYVLDDGSTTYCENETTLLDTCTNTSTLTFDYNTCNSSIMYSGGGVLYCLFYNQPSAGIYHITLYNDDVAVDNSETYRYTCIVLERMTDVSYATQYPLECQNSTVMNSTTVPSPGGNIIFTHNGSCPEPTTEITTIVTTTTATEQTVSGMVTGGIIGSVAFLASLIILIIILIKFKKNSDNGEGGKLGSKVQPETMAVIKVPLEKRGVDRNSRAIFTPAPPRINGDLKKDSSNVGDLKKHPSSLLIDLESDGGFPPSLEKEYTLPIYSDYGEGSDLEDSVEPTKSTPEHSISKITKPYPQLRDSGVATSTPPPNSTSPPDVQRALSRAQSAAMNSKKMHSSVVYGPNYAPVKDTAV